MIQCGNRFVVLMGERGEKDSHNEDTFSGDIQIPDSAGADAPNS
jgi:hypothetical protein